MGPPHSLATYRTGAPPEPEIPDPPAPPDEWDIKIAALRRRQKWVLYFQMASLVFISTVNLLRAAHIIP